MYKVRGKGISRLVIQQVREDGDGDEGKGQDGGDGEDEEEGARVRPWVEFLSVGAALTLAMESMVVATALSPGGA